MSSLAGETLDDELELLGEIRLLHSKRQPLNLAAVKRLRPELVKRAFSLKPFLGWIEALRKVGLGYHEINVELDEFVDCALCQRPYRRLCNHLKVHDITVEEYREQFTAEIQSEAERAKYQRRARSHSNPKRQLPLWDAPFCEEMVLDRLAEYHRQGVPVHYDEIDHRERTLVNFAVKYFGSWDEALRRIGLDPLEVRQAALAGAASCTVTAVRSNKIYSIGRKTGSVKARAALKRQVIEDDIAVAEG